MINIEGEPIFAYLSDDGIIKIEIKPTVNTLVNLFKNLDKHDRRRFLSELNFNDIEQEEGAPRLSMFRMWRVAGHKRPTGECAGGAKDTSRSDLGREIR